MKSAKVPVGGKKSLFHIVGFDNGRDSIDLYLEEDTAKDNPYIIALNKIDTNEKLLGWINQICDKHWVTTEHIQRLIKAAEKRNSTITIGYNL